MSPLVGGTVAEIYGYQYGFLIAGFGMVFGLISFLIWGKHLKGIGDPPAKRDTKQEMTAEEKVVHEQRLYEQTRPLVKQDWDRIFVIFVLAIFVMAFWIAFEQAGSSLNIFAKRDTDRSVAPVVLNVTPEWASKTLFLKNEDFLELQGIVQKVQMLADQVGREDEVAEGPSFAERINRFNIVSALWKEKAEEVSIEVQIAETKAIAAELRRVLRSSTHPIVQEAVVKLNQVVEETDEAIVEALIARLGEMQKAADTNDSIIDVIGGLIQSVHSIEDKALAAEKIREEMKQPALARLADRLPDSGDSFAEVEKRRTAILQAITTLVVGEQGKYGEQIQAGLLTMDDVQRKFDVRYEEGVEPRTFPATWYQSVNAMCVVIFIPLFMMLWAFLARFGMEPSTPTKFAIGLLLISASFIVMIPGAIEAKFTGGKAAMYYLLVCYLVATWGELCLSPIGLSMITKLSPQRYVSQFMGLWFLASSCSYLMAGYMASYFGSGEGISLFFGKEGGLADFFLLMAIIPFIVGIIALCLAPTLKRKMHGIH